MKKKALRSTRNRHTGRINEIKRNVLKHGVPCTHLSGRYVRAHKDFLCSMTVRDFAAERRV